MTFVSKEDLKELPFLKAEMIHVSPYILHEPHLAARMHQNEGVPLGALEKTELAAVCAAFISGDRGLNTYPSVDPVLLRSAMAELFCVPVDCVEPTSGSSQGISLVAQACFGSGKVISVVDPSFSLYGSVCALYGARFLPISLNPETFEYDLGAVHSCLETDVIVICNPNNPTGSVLPLSDIEEIVSSTKALVVVDEAYIEFCPQISSAVALVSTYKNILVLRTLSKAWGLAGLRLGAMVAHPDLIRIFNALKAPYSVAALSEHLGVYVLQNWKKKCAQKIIHTLGEQQKIFNALSTLPRIKMCPSHANFVCFVHPKSYELANELKLRHNILMRVYAKSDEHNHPLFGMARASVWSDEVNEVFLKTAAEILTGRINDVTKR